MTTTCPTCTRRVGKGRRARCVPLKTFEQKCAKQGKRLRVSTCQCILRPITHPPHRGGRRRRRRKHTPKQKQRFRTYTSPHTGRKITGKLYVPDTRGRWRISARKYYTHHRIRGSSHEALIGSVEEIRHGDAHHRLYQLMWKKRSNGRGYPHWTKIAHHR